MTSLEELEGIGKTRLMALHAAGIDSLRELLYVLPIRYRDASAITTVVDAQVGKSAVLRLKRQEAPKLSRFGKQSRVNCTMLDDTGLIVVSYFNQPYMKDNLLKRSEFTLYGTVTAFRDMKQLVNPSFVTDMGIQPVYRPIAGIAQKLHQSLVKQAMDNLDEACPETLPQAIIDEHGLCSISFAIRNLHFPKDDESLQIARRRYAFERFLIYQTAVRLMGARGGKGVRIPYRESDLDAYRALLPFSPTSAQIRTLGEIASDMAGDRPMARMVQGDVGCGKTAVAFGAMAFTVKAGYQAALMAPTVILARQHYEQAKPLFERLGVTCGLLVGGMTAKERREAYSCMKSGAWQIVIGTHALVSKSAKYSNLGLVITDEQHRFGVEQRTKLICKGDGSLSPNLLVMSATPIPRSLALILYGDLDISVIDELPSGRVPVTTRIVREEKRADMYRFITDEIGRGRQAYIVCPLVEDSEAMEDVKAAQSHVEALATGALKGARLALVHGRMSPVEKERALTSFASGEAQVLVSTTVIEVGINVPNATIMVIEDAEHYGLSQLHQIRGRVGRGSEQSWCFLMAKPNDRLRVLASTNDGFAIANEDLNQRGPGELLGTRQHGQASPFEGLPMVGDTRLLKEAADCADKLSRDIEREEQWRAIRALASELLLKVEGRVSAS